MEQLNFILDFVIIAAAIWTIVAVKGLGGFVGKAFGTMTLGMVFLGIAHLLETVTFEMLAWPVDLVEFVHRLIVLAGVAFITLGFKQIQKVRAPAQ
ncbi:MAG: hypothetical protein Q8R13_04355 [bacterium]|nr:hypothetical protein [bacterium]MDZ4296622.1 hypothetical protein [Patescibacteria group bacterium]